MYSPALPLTGWIFDVYPTSGGMVVWIVDTEGKSHRLVDPFQPSFYVAGPVKALRKLAAGDAGHVLGALPLDIRGLALQGQQPRLALQPLG